MAADCLGRQVCALGAISLPWLLPVSVPPDSRRRRSSVLDLVQDLASLALSELDGFVEQQRRNSAVCEEPGPHCNTATVPLPSPRLLFRWLPVDFVRGVSCPVPWQLPRS